MTNTKSVSQEREATNCADCACAIKWPRSARAGDPAPYGVVGSDDKGRCPACNTVHTARQARLIAAAPGLYEALNLTATMLDYEATCHEESGDVKRAKYVGPIRAQVAAARVALAKVNGEPTP